ncbi:hypothetical protein FJTKL_15535 [Diaporthe vaccinii]|uniref:Uncharacterized protein n=1 Tax=Diaporthe vaccinii TaxID=105482 RepID=A0ABR4F7B8_9PEZI
MTDGVGIARRLNSTSDRDDNTQSRTALQESTVKKSDKMAQEISDIKKFIEVCRRKDASCMFRSQPTR